MSLLLYILMWLVAVVCMTLFSALWSIVSGHQFREPVLLSKLLQHFSKTPVSERVTYALGWGIHLFLGIIFLIFYEALWALTNVPRTFLWSLAFGGILGIMGILGWTVLFKIADFPAQFDYPQFYLQLFFAHQAFAFTALYFYLAAT